MIEQKNSSQYHFSADFVRAMAIIFVVTVHVFGFYLAKATDIGSSSWWLSDIADTATKIAVPLFVILSGYLILDPSKNESVETFYKKRLSKIGIPILFWPVAYFFAFLLLSHQPFELSKFFEAYIFLNTFYHLYFLYIILGLYLLAPFLRKMLVSLADSEKKILLTLSFIFSISVTCLVYFTRIKLNYWSIFSVSIPFIGYFLLGNYLRNFRLVKSRLISLGCIFIGLVFLTSVGKYVAYIQDNPVLVRYFEDSLSINVTVTAILGYLILWNANRVLHISEDGGFAKIIKDISAASFGIYLIHPIFLFLYTKIVPLSGNFFSSLVEIGVVFGVSYLVVSIGRRIQFVKLFF